MADPSPHNLVHDSALALVLTEGVFGAPQADGPGVTIHERGGLTIQHLSGAVTDAEFPTKARHAIGLPLPMSVGETRDSGDTRVLWLGPDRWLVVSAAPLDLTALTAVAAVNDVGAGRLVLRVSGRRVHDLLAAGCPLDLDPVAFKPGQCAQTLMARLSVTLDCVEPDAFDLYVSRSHAIYFWEWLTGVAAEFGYRITTTG